MEENTAPRCPTCHAAPTAEAVAARWRPYCSVHCAHYAGLAEAAARRAEAES